MANIGLSPNGLTRVNLAARATAPTNPANGDIFLSDGTNYPKGMYRYDSANTTWQPVFEGFDRQRINYADVATSRSSTADVNVGQWITYNNQTSATFTNGSANITVGSATGLYVGMPLVFNGGSMPSGFTADTVTYYIVSIASTTITVSATLGGTAITAGSAGSGSHFLCPLVPTAPGSGTASGLTLSRTTSSPLRNLGSFSLVQSNSTDVAGMGASVAINIDTADQARVLSISFDYNASSTFVASSGLSGSDSDIEVWVYDNTNSTLIPVSPKTITASGSNNFTFAGTFQTASNSTSYRLCLHVSTGNANATGWTFKYDNVYVGPQNAVIGVPSTDWTNYGPLTINGSTTNPTKGTMTNDNFWVKIVGDTAYCRYEYNQTGTGSAAAGSGDYLWVWPANLPAIDTTKLTAYATIEGQGGFLNTNAVGVMQWTNNTSCDAGVVSVYDSTHFRMFCQSSGGVIGAVGSGFNPLSNAATVNITASFAVPLVGRSSNVLMSADTDSRLCAFQASRNGSNQTGINPNNSAVKLLFNSTAASTDKDTHGAYDTTNSKYVVQVAGRYHVQLHFQMTSTNVLNNGYIAMIYKNGSEVGRGALSTPPANSNFGLSASVQVDAVPGDYFEAYIFGLGDNSTNTLTMGGGATLSAFFGNRISGPSTIAATETIGASYASSSSSAWPTGETTFNPSIKNFDTHSAYSSGVFTCPAAGLYRVTACAAGNGTGSETAAIILKIYGGAAGTTLFAETINSAVWSTGFFVTDLASVTIQCNAGDLLKATYQYNGSTHVPNLAGTVGCTYVEFIRVK